MPRRRDLLPSYPLQFQNLHPCKCLSSSLQKYMRMISESVTSYGTSYRKAYRMALDCMARTRARHYQYLSACILLLSPSLSQGACIRLFSPSLLLLSPSFCQGQDSFRQGQGYRCGHLLSHRLIYFRIFPFFSLFYLLTRPPDSHCSTDQVSSTQDEKYNVSIA